MITKKITFDHHILEDGQLQVREITRIMEDEVELSKSYKRHVVEPGQPTAAEDKRTVRLMAIVHTPKTVADYEETAINNRKDGVSEVIKRLIATHGRTAIQDAVNNA